MSKNLNLISFTALVSLLHAVPAQAIEASEADLDVLRQHWELCHSLQVMPDTVEEMIQTHAKYWDEVGLPDPDDHYSLYIEAIEAVDCPKDEAEPHE